MKTPQTEKQTLALLQASLDRASSIKVTENGVPLSAVASVEIDEERIARLAAYDRARKKMLSFGYDPYWVDSVRHLVYLNRRPKIDLSEADLRKMRAEFFKQWPEVARFFSKK